MASLDSWDPGRRRASPAPAGSLAPVPSEGPGADAGPDIGGNQGVAPESCGKGFVENPKAVPAAEEAAAAAGGSPRREKPGGGCGVGGGADAPDPNTNAGRAGDPAVGLGSGVTG